MKALEKLLSIIKNYHLDQVEYKISALDLRDVLEAHQLDHDEQDKRIEAATEKGVSERLKLEKRIAALEEKGIFQSGFNRGVDARITALEAEVCLLMEDLGKDDTMKESAEAWNKYEGKPVDGTVKDKAECANCKVLQKIIDAMQDLHMKQAGIKETIRQVDAWNKPDSKDKVKT